ncbi:MAG: hypothetical protein IPM97_08370 [Bdellovibrionaceae bacterium]|nr:hypothetical protein [Pseudobdellovibrionaceae bacterium]
MRNILSLSCLLLLCSCAQLHHVQIGEVASHSGYVQKPFDIKISESGVNLGEAAEVSKILLNKDRQKDAEEIVGLIGLFQMGPITGNPVYVKDYAKNLIQLIYEKCPSGKVTGLMSVRESRKYPVVSGEIVKVTGYCLVRKGS